jgi:hypothetical protein
MVRLPQCNHAPKNRFLCIYHVITHRFVISRIAIDGVFLCDVATIEDGKPAFNRKTS